MASITTENLGNHIVTSEKLDVSITIPSLTATTAAITTLTLGGTAITATAAQLNGVCTLFDVTVGTAAIKADNSVANLVVPPVAGKQFFPVYAAMQAAGSVTTATTIRLVESTTAGVVLSHVAADMTSATWVSVTGGTVVTTKLNTALTVSEGIKVVDVTANTLTVTTAVRCIVAGYYI